MKPINLADKLSTFAEHFQPRTVGEFNGHDLMVVKVKGEFVWHKHDDTDDFFLVLEGRITIQMRDGNVVLGPGEMFVVPRGLEHCPIAEEEAHILLIEPTGTPNTGTRETAAPRRLIQAAEANARTRARVPASNAVENSTLADAFHVRVDFDRPGDPKLDIRGERRCRV